MVKYKYLGYGKNLSSWCTGTDGSTLLEYNALKYRGYYYDAETGFYYLNNRYYDPVIGRFISADTSDVPAVSPTALTDKNLYAYCDNNPIMRTDSDGEFWNIAAGALAATGLGYVGQAIGNAAISGVSEAISQIRNGNRDLGNIALNAGKMAIVGVASVAIGGKGIKAKGSAYSNSLNNLNSVKGNVSKAISNPKGYRHQINRAIKTHQVTTSSAVKSTAKSFGLANLFTNAVSRVKSFFGW